jgi:hypothetical protein
VVPVEQVNAAGSTLVRLCGLWRGTTRTGQPYFSGTLNDACKVLVFANDRREGGTT